MTPPAAAMTALRAFESLIARAAGVMAAKGRITFLP
jgi:hypothetical protein